MTAPKRPAIDRAADLMQSTRDNQTPFPVPPLTELKAIGPDLLREVADELAEEARIHASRCSVCGRTGGCGGHWITDYLTAEEARNGRH